MLRRLLNHEEDYPLEIRAQHTYDTKPWQSHLNQIHLKFATSHCQRTTRGKTPRSLLACSRLDQM